MAQNSQIQKAELFRAQHSAEKLLILPNCWDALSAKLLEVIGFPSVATASVATALINGYADGEKIPFSVLLKQVEAISLAVNVPVTVDMERGFAQNLVQLKDNVTALLDHGAVGLNIEDGLEGGEGLSNIFDQCRKIEAIREAGIRFGVNVVINARTDIFLQNREGVDVTKLAVERISAFKKAGADCAFPIFVDSYDVIKTLVDETDVPLNVFLIKPIADLKRLEQIGVARVSIGPGLIKAALKKMKNAAEGLMAYNSGELFRDELVSNDFIRHLTFNK